MTPNLEASSSRGSLFSLLTRTTLSAKKKKKGGVIINNATLHTYQRRVEKHTRAQLACC